MGEREISAVNCFKKKVAEEKCKREILEIGNGTARTSYSKVQSRPARFTVQSNNLLLARYGDHYKLDRHRARFNRPGWIGNRNAETSHASLPRRQNSQYCSSRIKRNASRSFFGRLRTCGRSRRRF